MKSLELGSKPSLEVLYSLPFGSHIYGTNTPNSDLDIICIIKESTGNFVLRYNDVANNTDITYVGLNEFIAGLANCSNVEFFEALHTEQGKKFLSDYNLNLDNYYNPRQAKAYLGYAKRDLDYPERLKYVLKSIYIATIIISNSKINLNTLAAELYEYSLNSEYFTKQGLSDLIKQLKRRCNG